MINVKEYLKEHMPEDSIGQYAIVSYDGEEDLIYFAHIILESGEVFTESPCTLYKIADVKEDIDVFCKNYVKDVLELEDGTDEDDYIKKYIKPMIVNGVFYEIENFQCLPFLPKEVENIKFITEKECLEELLKTIED